MLLILLIEAKFFLTMSYSFWFSVHQSSVLGRARCKLFFLNLEAHAFTKRHRSISIAFWGFTANCSSTFSLIRQRFNWRISSTIFPCLNVICEVIWNENGSQPSSWYMANSANGFVSGTLMGAFFSHRLQFPTWRGICPWNYASTAPHTAWFRT